MSNIENPSLTPTHLSILTCSYLRHTGVAESNGTPMDDSSHVKIKLDYEIFVPFLLYLVIVFINLKFTITK